MSSVGFSLPKYNGPLAPLDKAAFKKSIPLLAVRVPPNKLATVLHSSQLRNSLVSIPKVKPVVPLDGNARGLLLNVSDKEQLAKETLNYLEDECEGFTNYTLDLTYDHWSTSDIIHSILPEDLRDGAPVGFAASGHLAHLNLNDEYLPYKYAIGQVILDKNPTISTVVNKLDSIENQFRVFRMELLAGEPNYVVCHRESDCNLTFNFSEVYWNSRLQHEHARLVESFSPEDVVADVFAGVGPFALPAAKKGCGVLANDLNPNSFHYLKKNIIDNNLVDVVRASCEDGRAFMRTMFERVDQAPFPAFTGPRLSKRQEEKQRRHNLPVEQPSTPPSSRRKVTRVVMNLPDSAITFLDALRGAIPKSLQGVYDQMPLIHCYCFTRELEQEAAEVDIRQRVEGTMGHPISEEVDFWRVRSVAPGKEMYCITFRLPAEVAISNE